MTATLKTSEVASTKVVTMNVSGVNKLKDGTKVWRRPDTIVITFEDGKFYGAAISGAGVFIRRYTRNDVRFGYYVPEWIVTAIKRAKLAKKKVDTNASN